MKKRRILGYPKCAQWRFWSDCANAHADLNLRWAHMSEGWFPAVAAHYFVENMRTENRTTAEITQAPVICFPIHFFLFHCILNYLPLPASLTFTTLWANSADDKLMIVFLFFPENRVWHFEHIVSIGDNLHELSKPSFCEKKKRKEKYFNMSSDENFTQGAKR